jgi:hypothetical protein
MTKRKLNKTKKVQSKTFFIRKTVTKDRKSSNRKNKKILTRKRGGGED